MTGNENWTRLKELDIDPGLFKTAEPVNYTLPKTGSGYSSTSRTGTVDTRNQTSNLDTTDIDNKISDAQKALAESQKGNKLFTPKYKREHAQEYNNWVQGVNTAQANLQNLQKQKQNYLASNANVSDVSASQAQANQALKSAAVAESGTAQANKSANLSGGMNRSLAGMMGSSNASKQTASTANPLFTANSSGAASTQADYLEKMGQAKALDTQASALNKSANLAGLASGIQGFGSGASVGAALANSGDATSDETQKESPEKEPSMEELLDMTNQFFQLYNKLQDLKKRK